MIFDHPHRRYNLLTGEWVLVSPHRTKRPWQGQIEKVIAPVLASYDPECYLCPGNERADGAVNPLYDSTFVFENDFAALYPQVANEVYEPNNLLIAKSEKGLCRVICFSPDHGLTLARMSLEAIEKVVECWTEQFLEIGKKDFVRSILIFENRGQMMGASNPHPHGQIWASQSIPNEPAKELRNFAEYRDKNSGCLLCDYVRLELKKQERVVCENALFAAIVPFWAVYPFETLVVPKAHRASLAEFSAGEKKAFAEILRRLTVRYDNLFETPFPYSFGLHQSPVNAGDNSFYHFHAHFYPPLLRSATIRKFLVGFEILGSPQRDITPEQAAAKLKMLREIHYSEKE